MRERHTERETHRDTHIQRHTAMLETHKHIQKKITDIQTRWRHVRDTVETCLRVVRCACSIAERKRERKRESEFQRARVREKASERASERE